MTVLMTEKLHYNYNLNPASAIYCGFLRLPTISGARFRYKTFKGGDCRKKIFNMPF